MDVLAWIHELTAKLDEAFGARIMFVGLQGSRARGEARENSDIDVVVLLDVMTVEDLARYRILVESMPRSELACGFIGSVDVLASWPRYELFHFYNDTVPIYGELPYIVPFTRDDAIQAARIGASGIYHAACHAIVFDCEAAVGVFESLFKNAFFVLRALQFARTDAYPRNKAELSELLDGDEALILEVSRSWNTRRPSDRAGLIELGDLLIRWAESIMRSMDEGRGAAMNLGPFLQSTEYIDFGEERVERVA